MLAPQKSHFSLSMATLMIAYRLSEKRGKLVKTAILTMELLLLSTGLISTFFMLKKAISPRWLFNKFIFNLSEILNSLKSFLSSPLYICLFINSVVILILTFSKFHHPTMEFLNVFLDDQKDEDHYIQIHEPQAHDDEIKEDMNNMANRTNSVIAMDAVMSFFSRYNSNPPHVSEDTPSTTIEDEIPCSVKDIEIDCVTKLSFPSIPPLTHHEAREIVNLRSPNRAPQTITTRTNYDHEHEDDDDSLDATWKAITGGGNDKKKKKQVLKKSETWPMEPETEVLSTAQSIGSKDLLPSVAAAWKELRKSVTFNDTLSVFRRGGLRGDISVSTEESNKRFDDFIKKINHERILQRQESDQRAFNNNMLNRAR
ncbi:hypothetical protein HAX54_001538 [Datura stramonium]|uniref:DUF4408 domain-containing protein n=1 Tax=Datura stramonium TaxID=4076 RepID=A0ABS8RU82_DATST|nr:hypothetical protein [Datura stramonium]